MLPLGPPLSPASACARALPGYTFECASDELWRSRFDATRNVIVVKQKAVNVGTAPAPSSNADNRDGWF
jgi:hypothetical protein